jgi:peroxiredoxin Q/BCP
MSGCPTSRPCDARVNVRIHNIEKNRMRSIRVGDTVPDNPLTVHDDRTISLADFKGKQTVVLFFYPADDMPLCTREVCSFRDAYQEFVRAGAAVIGVSGDSEGTHRAFAQAQQLPYLLVADADGSMRRAFGVPTTFGLMAGRVTYVIDRDGVVRDVFKCQFSAQKHVDNALRIVRSLETSQHLDT